MSYSAVCESWKIEPKFLKLVLVNCYLQILINFKVIFTDICKFVVTSSDFLLQVFFLIVIAVAIVIYLGTARDYLSLSQYSTLAPKGDISEQGRLE